MKVVYKYSGYFFIIINLFILAGTFYVYYFFNKKTLSYDLFSEYRYLSKNLTENYFLITVLYAIVAVSGLLLIENRRQKIIASILIVMAYLLFSFIEQTSFL